MATATGQYASLGLVKANLGITDAKDDAVIQLICDRTNQLIETLVGRALCPIPYVNTTLASQASSGQNQLVLTSGANVTPGMNLLIGDMNATTQESGVVLSVSGATVTLTANLAATYASGKTVITTYLFDGAEMVEGGAVLLIPTGLISVVQVRTGFMTGSTLQLLPTSQWQPRPQPQNRKPGWPYTQLWMTTTPSTWAPLFQSTAAWRGPFSNIEVAGQLGWPAPPDDVVDVGVTTATRAWQGRQSGQQDVVGSDILGRPVISRFLSARDHDVLTLYRDRIVEVR